jgi:hypothetical protein
MKTGLDSLDTGAPRITYSGNEGPKPPMKMAGPDRYFKILEFKINELEGELGRDLTDEEYEAVSEEAYEEFNFGARAPQGIESIKMASYRPGKYDPEDIEMYEQYKYDMEEQKPGMPIMEIDEFLRLEKERARIGVANGGIAMQGSKKPVVQGGVDNYLGDQPQVVVPRNWQSGPDKPPTELAYITEAEKKLLLKEDIHGSLKDGPNEGPAGIMSLDSFGDISGGQSGADYDSDPGGTKSGAGTYGGGGEDSKRPDRTNPNLNTRSTAFTQTNNFTTEVDDKLFGPTTSTTSTDPMDIKEQYRVGNLADEGDMFMSKPNVTFDAPYMSKKLEEKRQKNIDDAEALEKATYKPVKTPFQFINTPANLIAGFGFEKNKAFFAKRVAGKYGYGYSEEEMKRYMKDRMAGRVNAVGRPLTEFEKTLIYGEGGPDPNNLIAEQTTPPGTVPPGTTPPGTTPPGTTPSPFLPATNFNQYDTDQANKAYMLSLGVDPRMFAADGGRMGYAGGGIADLRQGYFLGKLVKKVTRGAKKVLKSPFGRAAIMAGLGAFGLNKYGQGVNFMDKLKNLGRIAFLNKDATQFTKANINPFKIFGGISALSALPLLFGTGDEEGSMDGYRGEGLDIRGIRGDVAKRNLNPIDYPFMPQEYYMANGGIAGARTSALNQLYGIDDDEDEVKKLSQGGSAGLPPVTMMSEGQNIQSFPDDESTGMVQATPQNQMPMPMRPPMIDPRIQQQMMMSRSMSPMMNPMMNPMMRGMPMMGGRMLAQEGGIMMASVDEPFYRSGDEDEHSFRMFNKPYKELNAEELEEFREEMMRLMNKFSSAPDPMDTRNDMMQNLAIDNFGKPLKDLTEEEIIQIEEMMDDMDQYSMARPRVMAQEGGMMDMGGMEKDYRNEGGFVAIGGQERADDVPARLSKNEFVFTADAVRNAGGGDIDKGAEIMENMMENLEAGGKVSQESQGLKGARQMFQTSQRLEEVL